MELPMTPPPPRPHHRCRQWWWWERLRRRRLRKSREGKERKEVYEASDNPSSIQGINRDIITNQRCYLYFKQTSKLFNMRQIYIQPQSSCILKSRISAQSLAKNGRFIDVSFLIKSHGNAKCDSLKKNQHTASFRSTSVVRKYSCSAVKNFFYLSQICLI